MEDTVRQRIEAHTGSGKASHPPTLYDLEMWSKDAMRTRTGKSKPLPFRLLKGFQFGGIETEPEHDEIQQIISALEKEWIVISGCSAECASTGPQQEDAEYDIGSYASKRGKVKVHQTVETISVCRVWEDRCQIARKSDSLALGDIGIVDQLSSNPAINSISHAEQCSH